DRGFRATEAGDVPARLVEPWDDAAGDGFAHVPKDDWDRPRLTLDGNGRRSRVCQDDVGLQAHQLLRERSYPIVVIAVPTEVHPHVAIGPTQIRKRLREHRVATLALRIVFVPRHEHADAPYAVALLRARHHRPRRRAPEPRDELSPPDHSITSSARRRIDCGTVRPSALAVLRFTTISNLVGNCTGRSAGFAPRRMRSTYEAARREMSTRSAPYVIKPPSLAKSESQ